MDTKYKECEKFNDQRYYSKYRYRRFSSEFNLTHQPLSALCTNNLIVLNVVNFASVCFCFNFNSS